MVKQYDKTRKTVTGQGEDYTTGCVLDYQYFKDHYNLIAVDLNKQKQSDADSRAIGFYEMLKTNSQVCTVLEKSKETMLEFYKGTAKFPWIIEMVECSKVNVKLSDAQLKKLKTAVKKKIGTALKMSLKMLDENGLAHELLLTTRQKTKLINAFNDNMLTD